MAYIRLDSIKILISFLKPKNMKIIQKLEQVSSVTSLSTNNQKTIKGGAKKSKDVRIIEKGQSSPPRWKDKR